MVSEDISLDRLHDVIQIVMGWQDSHLHSFTFKKRNFVECPESPNDENEAFIRLNELLKKHGNTLRYVYDFGDEWEHEIYLEDKAYFDDQMLGPIECIAGLMACPPEDCGGAAAYMHILQAIFDPQNNEDVYEEFLEEMGLPDIDVAELQAIIFNYDVDTANYALAQYLRWSRERALPLMEDEG